MIVIVDSSPLILLARIGRLPLLRSLYGELLMPTAVHQETVLQDPKRPGAQAIAKADWIRIREVTDAMAVTMLRQQVGSGESEAIVLALESAADLLIIDDAKGRRIAEAYGIPAVGSIGVLIQAKKRGIIEAVKPDLDAIQQAGLRMNSHLYTQALRLAEEEPEW